MILNQMTNHVREIILALRTEFVEVPDYITQIFDSFARYKSGGAAGLGISIPTLQNRGKAVFYSGLDQAQEIVDDTMVERHFAYWKHMAADVVMPGTDLKQMVGLTCSDLIRQDYALGHMNENDMLMLLNLFKSKYTTTAAGLQGKKVTAVHGHYQTLEDSEVGREPESLDDLFDPEGMFHGVNIDELGEWDNDHVFGRRPLSNDTDNESKKKYRNRPIIRYVGAGESTSGSAKTKDDALSLETGFIGSATTTKKPGSTTPILDALEPELRRLQQVVKGTKLGYMQDDGFSALVAEIRGSNDRVPLVTLGGAGWEFDMDCVKIAGTTIIPDPNAKVGTLRVLHVGTAGMDNGTVFPFYYDPLVEPIEAMRMEAEMLSANRGRPKGMDFGMPRQVPFHGSEWARTDKYVDACHARMFLDYIPVVCLVRGFQGEFRFKEYEA